MQEGFVEQEERHKIARAFEVIDNAFFPRHWSAQKDNPIKNDKLHVGYRAVDMQLDAPYLKTDEEVLLREMERQEAEGMNLSEYDLANLVSKLTTGHYLDEKTWSRIPASSGGGRIVCANVGGDGDLYVDSGLLPQYQVGYLGGRFSLGVK